ncbi:MAG: ABC transporter permease subunit [Fimbriiglobus sp.]|nr:ABC transporter permease subunit [Fimbriiglobus sp.]
MLLGPLFRFELVRLARRGTHLPLRVALALLLLVGLLAAYLQLFPSADVGALLFGGAALADPARLDKFAETFLLIFLIAQQTAVLLLTPVYAGGALAEEKEKGRLDFLLTSPLGRWELVLGKLAARLVFVLAVILTGVPVMAFTLLFGGVDPPRVLAGFVVSAVSAVAVGAFAVMLSVLRPTLRDVLLWAFGGLSASGLLGLLLLCSNPPTVRAGGVASPVTVLIPLYAAWNQPPATGDPTWELVGLFAALHLPMAALFMMVAVANVRAVATRPTEAQSPAALTPVPVPVPAPPPPPPDEPPLPEWYKVPERPAFDPALEVPAAADGRGFLVPALGELEDPFDWKERHFSARLPLIEGQWLMLARGCAVAAFLFALGLGLFVGVASGLRDGRGPGDTLNAVVRVVLAVAAAVLPFAGVRAAASVAEERAKKTLDSLFSLPIERSTILWAKVRAAAHRSRGWGIGAALAVMIATLAGGLHPFVVPSLVASFAGYAVFTLGLGVLLGVVAKSTVRAVLAHLVVTLATFFGPIVLAPLVGEAAFFLSTPLTLAWGAADPAYTLSGSEGTAACMAFPIGLGYALSGWGLWWRAVRRFEHE